MTKLGSELIDKYLSMDDMSVKENSNMGFSLQGLNNFLSSEITKKHWLDYIYNDKIAKAHKEGDIHIHDLNILGSYCSGWDLKDILLNGFVGAADKIESGPAKHLRVILGQMVNFIFTLQGECYSDDTEVLTLDGFKLFKNLKENDLVCTLNINNNKIEYQKPIRFIKKEINGNLLNFKTKKMDTLVTAGHKMLVKKKRNSKIVENLPYEFVNAEDILSNSYCVPKCVKWSGNKEEYFTLPSVEKELYIPSLDKYQSDNFSELKIKMKAWLKFLGYFISEGSLYKRTRNRKDRNKPYFEYLVRITQKKEEQVQEIKEILDNLPFKYNFTINKIGCYDFKISSKQLFIYLEKLNLQDGRFIPKEIKNLSKEYLEILFSSLMSGDGYIGNGNIEYSTKSYRLASDIQEIILKIGHNANIYPRSKGKFKWFDIVISMSKTLTLNEPVKVNYNGFVYCVEVPNHTLYIRRNGKAHWCGNCAGAQAFSNVDTLLAPFIRYDNLSFKDVKQCLQEFVFNLNIPTRTGFQCMSEDTEILSQNGWKKHNELKVGDIIATFNLEKNEIEYLPIKKLFAREYEGKMFNLKNRISDQLISPKHRVVRKVFNSNKYILEEIEEALKNKTGLVMPNFTNGTKGNTLDSNIVKLIAWIISDGTQDINGKGIGRISIIQSKIKNLEKYNEIVQICKDLNLNYTEREQQGIGSPTQVLRFNSESTGKILEWFNSNKEKGIKFIPKCILNLNSDLSKLFIETYIKGDGHEDCKIVTTDVGIKDSLMHVAVNAGYGCTLLIRKPKENSISKKDQFVIRIIKTKELYIKNIKEIDYKGIIWCPNTDNETVIARRNGKTFITGNTPFSNITLDLVCPNKLKDQNVIIGGTIQKEFYKDFKKEVKMFNDAFFEIMLEGDVKGKIFTFPVVTINVDKNFNWDNELLWKLTTKYGTPNFVNYISSGLNIEDTTSLCCRLMVDKNALKRGGMFSSIPLVGGIGVTTINLARIGYLAKTENDFFRRLERIMDTCKESLEIKREIIEKFMDVGLYPYSKFYLRDIKARTGKYTTYYFSIIAPIAMNECLLNYMGKSISSEEGKKFALKVIDFMKDKLKQYAKETGNNYSLEQSPSEGASGRLKQLDLKFYPEMLCNKKNPHIAYTNSTHLPVDYTDDIFYTIGHQSEFNKKYDGGSILHLFLGERVIDPEIVKNFMKAIFENYPIPYINFTPTFSICKSHGYLEGEVDNCPKCNSETLKYSRVVGYYRPVQSWARHKREEFKNRKTFKIKE